MTATPSPVTMHHTPGPWAKYGHFIVAADPQGVHPDIYIAEIAEEDSEDRIAPPEQQWANAALVAAAPDMLDALELARDRLEVSNYAGEEDEALKAIEDAITAAKGGAA